MLWEFKGCGYVNLRGVVMVFKGCGYAMSIEGMLLCYGYLRDVLCYGYFRVCYEYLRGVVMLLVFKGCRYGI
jgi:hypothetical protein